MKDDPPSLPILPLMKQEEFEFKEFTNSVLKKLCDVATQTELVEGYLIQVDDENPLPMVRLCFSYSISSYSLALIPRGSVASNKR